VSVSALCGWRFNYLKLFYLAQCINSKLSRKRSIVL
jgi:hypothetical protein